MKQRVTVSLVHDTRKPLKGGLYSVKIRVTWNREQRYYPTGKFLSPDEFDKVMGPRPRNEAKETRLYLDAFYAKLKTIAEEMKAFSFEQFERELAYSPKVKTSVQGMFETYIDTLRNEGRVSTATSYQCALNAILQFETSPNFSFSHITPEWLSRFEKWFTTTARKDISGRVVKQNGTSTTVGIYLRSLRTIYNQAIAQRIALADNYPFGRNRYLIPSGRNVKKAVAKADIRKLFEFDAAPGSESYCRDLWVFSYLCNGANLKDIARLKYANIDGDRIYFIRSKTERSTKQDLKPIVAALVPQAKVIIERWGQKPSTPQAYVFPILEPGCSPERERKLVQGIVKMVNKYIRRIAKEVGITQQLTTYTARHSFATILKQNNAPISYISEALGHKDLKTTENYLGSFDDDTRKQYAAALTDF